MIGVTDLIGGDSDTNDVRLVDQPTQGPSAVETSSSATEEHASEAYSDDEIEAIISHYMRINPGTFDTSFVGDFATTWSNPAIPFGDAWPGSYENLSAEELATILHEASTQVEPSLEGNPLVEHSKSPPAEVLKESEASLKHALNAGQRAGLPEAHEVVLSANTSSHSGKRKRGVEDGEADPSTPSKRVKGKEIIGPVTVSLLNDVDEESGRSDENGIDKGEVKMVEEPLTYPSTQDRFSLHSNNKRRKEAQNVESERADAKRRRSAQDVIPPQSITKRRREVGDEEEVAGPSKKKILKTKPRMATQSPSNVSGNQLTTPSMTRTSNAGPSTDAQAGANENVWGLNARKVLPKPKPGTATKGSSAAPGSHGLRKLKGMAKKLMPKLISTQDVIPAGTRYRYIVKYEPEEADTGSSGGSALTGRPDPTELMLDQLESDERRAGLLV